MSTCIVCTFFFFKISFMKLFINMYNEISLQFPQKNHCAVLYPALSEDLFLCQIPRADWTDQWHQSSSWKSWLSFLNSTMWANTYSSTCFASFENKTLSFFFQTVMKYIQLLNKHFLEKHNYVLTNLKDAHLGIKIQSVIFHPFYLCPLRKLGVDPKNIGAFPLKCEQ